MVYYLSAFSIAFIFSAIAENKYKNKKMKLGHIFSAIAILVVCLLAALRNVNVGTDLLYYVVPYINNIKWYPTFIEYMTHIQIEPMFAILTFVTGKFFNTPFFVLFMCELLTILPIYLSIYKKRDDISISFSYIVFLLLFFNMTLCIMRQFVAIALIIYGFICCENNKFKRNCIFSIAILFHYTSIIFIGAYIICNKINNSEKKGSLKILMVLGLLFFIVFIPVILNFFANTIGGVAKKYYDVFLNKQLTGHGISIIEMTLKFIIFFIPVFLNRRMKDNMCSELNFFVLLGFIFSLSAIVSEYLVRVSYFFNLFSIFSVTYACNLISSKHNGKLTYKILMMLICLLYWYIIYFLWNNYGTFPYLFYGG